LFYSTKFVAAVAVLRWICLGGALQVITWPMGFIIVAKGNQILFFLAELGWTIVAIALSWACLRWFGLNGAGIAFFGSYVFHMCLVYPIVRWITGFSWSKENQTTGVAFFGVTALVFAGFYVMPIAWAVSFGLVVSLVSTVYSVRLLVRLVQVRSIPRPFFRLLKASHLLPSEAR
jgi:PST family polysaccharide transporter